MTCPMTYFVSEDVSMMRYKDYTDFGIDNGRFSSRYTKDLVLRTKNYDTIDEPL